MTQTAEAIKIQRGLIGVYFDRSPCTFIDGKAGELRYRGYSIHDLAEHSTFEEAAWLLLNGELPTRQQLASFVDGLKSRAQAAPSPDPRRYRGHDIGASDGRIAHCSSRPFSAFDPETSDNSREATLRKAVRLTAQVPVHRGDAFAPARWSAASARGRKSVRMRPICCGC